MKRKTVLKTSGLILVVLIAITGYATEYAKVTANNISESVLRLHVIANSNEKCDQDLKLAVRDEIIRYTGIITKDVNSREEVKKILEENLASINYTANRTIKEKGYKYQATAKIGKSKFPTKIYGDISFPAGEYDALIVTIGKGDGKNWWCVLYPQLCVNNSSQKEEPSDNNFATLSEESKNRLKKVLTKEEYKIISENDNKTVKIKFKLLEAFGKLK